MRRLKKVGLEQINFLLKVPSEKEKRKTFQILKRFINRDTKKRRTEAVQDERLDALNKLYTAGVHDLIAAKKLALDIIEHLYKAQGQLIPDVVFNSENRKLLATYWEEEYSHRQLVDASSSKYELERAIEALGPVSLVTAPAREIQAKINGQFKGNKQRRIISTLNQLLVYLRRKDVHLTKAREEIKRVRHLTEAEFLSMTPHIEDETFRLLAEADFYSGLRFGELFGLSEESVRPDESLYVDRQVLLTKKGEFVYDAAPKWGKSRSVLVFPQGLEAVRKVCAMDKTKLTEEYRKKDAAEIIRKACIKAFPEKPAKWCVFHDLRHSYAIMLFNKRFNISWVARNLGNNEDVCRKNYVGYINSDETIAAMKALLTEKKS